MKKLTTTAAIAAIMLMAGCDSGTPNDNTGDDTESEQDEEGGITKTDTLDMSVCDPSLAVFTADITNAWSPFTVGAQWILEGEEDGESIQLEVNVLVETRTVAGVTTRVIEEKETVDGVLHEISLNFFAQSEDGTVCYFGEEVDWYDETSGTEIVNHDGAWTADDPGNLPGIHMPASPAVGQIYSHERAPGLAQDQAENASMGDSITVPFGTFTDTLSTEETSPIEPDTGTKQYANGVGLIADDTLVLISHTPGN